MSAKSLLAFGRLSRPHFLLGGALLFALGSMAVPTVNLGRYLMGQFMVTFAQLTAHYVNEYADVEPDRLVTKRTFFSGGSGVLTTGELAPRVALRAAWVTTAFTLVLATRIGLTTPTGAILGIAALAVSWSYSMPPIRLLSSGWGELLTSLVVAGLVPLTAVAVQGSQPTTWLWWGIAVLIPIHLAMMLIFEIPDLESDEASGKRVLAVRIGPLRTRRLLLGLAAFSVLPMVSGIVGEWLPPPAALGLLAALPAAATWRALGAERYGVATTGAVATLVLATLGLIAGAVG